MPHLTPNVTLAEQVAEQLRARIAAGEFVVGDLIPTERELVDELGVSRNSVREALRALVHAGLLRARAGHGTVVVATSDVAPALSRRVEQDRAGGRPQDIAEVRLLLEREAARFAALRATDAHRAELREALAARTAAQTAPDYVAADLQFHRALLAASGNALLAEMGRGTGGNEQALLHLDSAGVDLAAHRAELRQLDELHDHLVDAVEARDPERAAELAERLVTLAHAGIPEDPR